MASKRAKLRAKLSAMFASPTVAAPLGRITRASAASIWRRYEPSMTEILQLIEETTTLNHPPTAEQFAQMREQRARQVREMSAETFAALRKKMQQSWAALGRDEQALLVEQRRVISSQATAQGTDPTGTHAASQKRPRRNTTAQPST